MAFEPPAPRLGVVGKLAEVDMVIPSKVRREDELDCTIKNALGWEGEALRKESWGRMPPASEGAGHGGRLGASMLIYGGECGCMPKWAVWHPAQRDRKAGV